MEYLQGLSDDELLSEEDKIIFNKIKIKERRDHLRKKLEVADRLRRESVREKRFSVAKVN